MFEEELCYGYILKQQNIFHTYHLKHTSISHTHNITLIVSNVIQQLKQSIF